MFLYRKLRLRGRVALLIILFALAINLFSVALGYRTFVRTNTEFSSSAAETVARTCVLIIDSDRIQQYAATLERDTAYYETWNRLIDYRNTNDNIVSLSMVQFREDGCHYIFDTDLTEQGAFLGDSTRYDALQQPIRTALQNGEDIGYLTYASHIDVYMPVLSSYDIPLGYVVVGISTADAVAKQIRFLFQFTIIQTLVAVVVCAGILVLIRRSVVDPINRLSSAAANYEALLDEGTSTSELSRLDIRTHDEIEALHASMMKMEQDIKRSSSRLAIANWNSYHESMTGLFNKRHLTENREALEAYPTIGVIYMDVDNLKRLNDSSGHEAGDAVIRRTGAFIQRHAGAWPKASAYRLGGDEFLLLVGDCEASAFEAFVETMRADAGRTLTEPDSPVQCRIAIGARFQENPFDIERIIKQADEAMYRDKRSRRGAAAEDGVPEHGEQAVSGGTEPAGKDPADGSESTESSGEAPAGGSEPTGKEPAGGTPNSCA